MIKPSTRPFRIIGYSRVSTFEQASEGMSLDAQESRIRAWCEAQDAELVEIVRDCQRSSNPAAQRDGVQVIQHPGVHVIPHF
jgi:DNA invertase Pin-like site-specific DNA recombinase